MSTETNLRRTNLEETNLGEKIYDSTAELGSIRAKIFLGFGIILGIIMIIIAGYLFFKDQSNLIDTKAVVKSVSYCNKNISVDTNKSNKNNKFEKETYNCEITINYSINGSQYEKKLLTNKGIINHGETIEITYDKNNPNDVTEKILRYKTISYILLGISIFIISLSSISYYIASKSKLYSAVLGADTVYSIFK